MNAYAKPLPQITDLSAPFWQGLQEGRLRVQQCRACGHRQHPPQPGCRKCWRDDLEWVSHPDTGEVYTYSVCYWAAQSAFKTDVPYVVAIIDLPDGVRISTNIVDCDPASVRIGMLVRAVYEPVTGDVTLLKFKPVQGSAP